MTKFIASIIIPTYKRTDFLLRAINSSLNQTCKDFEIIIVDDNGKGTELQLVTENIIKNYASQPNFKYLILEQNYGGSIARNKGAEIANGKYLFFLDDDDEFLPTKLRTQINFLEENPQFDGCLTNMIRKDHNLKNIESESNKACVGDFKNYVLKGNFFTPMLCIKKQSFITIGGFKKIDRYQDRYFMLHCLSKKIKFEVIDTPTYIMHEHEDDRITYNSIQKSIDSLNIIKKYITNYKDFFSTNEWNEFLLKDNFMRGVLFYISNNYKTRLISIKYWVKNIFINPKLLYFTMILKSLMPRKLIK